MAKKEKAYIAAKRHWQSGILSLEGVGTKAFIAQLAASIEVNTGEDVVIIEVDKDVLTDADIFQALSSNWKLPTREK